MQYAIFIDIESNGLDPALHRCLEVAFQVVDVHSGEEKTANCGIACPSLSKDAIAATYGLLPEQKPHRAMRGV